MYVLLEGRWTAQEWISIIPGIFFFLIFKIIVETDLVEKETLGLIHVLNIVFEMIYTTIL